MRTVNVVLLLALLAGALWAWLGTRPDRAPVPDEEGAVTQAPTAPPLPPAPVTAALLIRVRTADGSPLPEGTEAGYLRFGSLRLRPPAPDGSFPFSDAPVGRLEVTAKPPPGWTADTVTLLVVPGVPAEAVVTLARE